MGYTVTIRTKSAIKMANPSAILSSVVDRIAVRLCFIPYHHPSTLEKSNLLVFVREEVGKQDKDH